MKLSLPILILALLHSLSASADVQVEFEFILEVAYGTDLSADGSVVAGNTAGTYEAFRWSESGGFDFLGASSVSVLGAGGGSPNVSADGMNVSASILSADSTHVTAGIWREGSGWEYLAPPAPPDAGLVDVLYADAWGMSGDGSTTVGMYWRPCGATCGGSTRAIAWTSLGYTQLDTTSVQGSSRANAANYDGSVVVGWKSHTTGPRQAAVWRAGTMEVLADGTYGGSTLECASPDGNIVAGNTVQFVDGLWTRPAAYWIWNGSTWDEHVIGMLPFTSPAYGSAVITDTSADGSIMVGYHNYGFNNLTGVIWTEETGLLETEQWLAYHGVSFNEPFSIESLQAVSEDGRVLIGIGRDTVAPYVPRTFRITIDSATPAPIARTDRMTFAPARPNPFNPATILPLSLTTAASVELQVFDLRGRLVRTLHTGNLPAGDHEFSWDGRDDAGRGMASGGYLARARSSAGESAVQRLMLLK